MPKNHITHGMSNTRLYRVWQDMKNRCKGTKKRDKQNYHDRGVSYCEDWEKFEPFRDWALSNGYDDNLTIDRVDVNGNYDPSNCRWVTRAEQNNNTRQNHYITFNGETHTVRQWADILGIKPSTLRSRLNTYKWSVEEAFNVRILRGGQNRCNTSY